MLEFTIGVNTEGYEWVSAEKWDLFGRKRRHFLDEHEPEWRIRPPWNSKDTPRLLLRDRRSMFDDGDVRVVHPTIEDAALYRNFARIEPSPESVAEFANRYGNLWTNQYGVPFGEWEFEIRTMRWLIDVWDAIDGNGADAIAEHFPLDKSGCRKRPYADTICRYPLYGRRASLRSTRPEDAPLSDFGTPETFPRVARQYVLDGLGARLFMLGADFALRQIDHQLRFSIAPRSLIGALWLQFAESIAAQKKYRQCEVCERYMELSPNVNRADRRYCDDACRNRALRRRQKLAREMRESGKSLRDISKGTGSDINTLKQWLRPKGK
jgi:hypothetical protein